MTRMPLNMVKPQTLDAISTNLYKTHQISEKKCLNDINGYFNSTVIRLFLMRTSIHLSGFEQPHSI